MKKVIAAVLAALTLCSGALAMDNLQGAALVGEGLIYYAGSLDGKTMGVFRMDQDGQNAQMLFAGDASVLAGNAGTVLVCDFGQDAAGGVALLDAEGKELYRLGIQVSEAIESQGRYFVGGHMLWLEDGEACERAYIDIAADQQWMIQPVYAQDDTLYYLDSTRYGGQGVEGAVSSGKLMRMDLATGESVQISPEGTTLLGVWENRAVYTRRNFYIYQNDDSLMVETKPGLYIAGENGGEEVFLAALEEQSEASTVYSLLRDGVVYGSTVNYAQEPPTALLKRVQLPSEVLPDAQMPVAALSGAAQGQLYLCESYYHEEGEYYQEDRILRVDPLSGQTDRLNQDRVEVLCYSEADPKLVIQNGRIYYLDFDGQRSAVRLCAIDMDGANYAVLAQGYEWENVGS